MFLKLKRKSMIKNYIQFVIHLKAIQHFISNKTKVDWALVFINEKIENDPNLVKLIELAMQPNEMFIRFEKSIKVNSLLTTTKNMYTT